MCISILYLFYIFKCVVLFMNIRQTNPLSSMPHSAWINLFRGIFHCWKHLVNSVMGLFKSCCIMLIVHCSSATSLMISTWSALTKSSTSAITISFPLHKDIQTLGQFLHRSKDTHPFHGDEPTQKLLMAFSKKAVLTICKIQALFSGVLHTICHTRVFLNAWLLRNRMCNTTAPICKQ